MMAWPEKIFFSGGGSKKSENFFSHFWVLFDVDLAMKAKKTGVRIPVWRYGPCRNSVQEGWKLCFAVFSVFFLLGTGEHPHPPPTTYWCQTNLKYDFWGLGTTWPHQPPKIVGSLAPWATAKGRTPWDGASPLAQGGPPPVALSTSYRGVNATSFEIFGAQVARNKGIGEKFHHSWSGRVRCVGAPGRQIDRTGLLDFFSHQNMQNSRNNHRKRVTPLLTIVLSICEPVFWAV